MGKIKLELALQSLLHLVSPLGRVSEMGNVCCTEGKMGALQQYSGYKQPPLH